MIVYTAPLFFRGADALDIGQGTTDAAGIVLAPTFGETLSQYAARLFGLSQARGRVFSGLLALDTITLTCTCLDAETCHRTTLAWALISRGAIAGGERPRETVPFICGVRLCDRIIDTGQALCAEHWCMLPFDLQRELLATYTENQRYTGLCSPRWMRAMDQAVCVIGEVENGIPDVYGNALRKQDNAWHDAMNPPGKADLPTGMRTRDRFAFKANGETVATYEFATTATEQDEKQDARETAAQSGPSVPAPPGPKPRPKAPAKPRKRGGWQFSGGKLHHPPLVHEVRGQLRGVRRRQCAVDQHALALEPRQEERVVRSPPEVANLIRHQAAVVVVEGAGVGGHVVDRQVRFVRR